MDRFRKKPLVTDQLTHHEAVALLEIVDAARQCTEIEALYRLIDSLDRLLSFDMAVCGMARIDGGGETTVQRIVNISYPQEWLSIYAERGFVAIDPVVCAHFANFSPKIWSETYEQWGRPRPFLSLAEDFGIREGCSFGAFSPGRATATIFSLCTTEKQSQHALKIVNHIAPYFHEALQRVMRTDLPDCIGSLTPREYEVIRWMANGKSTWDMSVILGISERTVKFHIAAILQKLGASNRTHAVAKAISNRLISLD